MLTVTQDHYIKDLRNKEDETISGIARRLEISWPTAKKYADSPVDHQTTPRQRRKRRVMDGFEEQVEAWLLEDMRIPKKQRRTAKAIYEQLREIGYKGSARTVRNYVREAKERIVSANGKHYNRLDHDPGEAQVDFGEFWAISSSTGERVKKHHLVMSFPHSNGALARALPGQNAECLLTGMIDMFEEIGGAPPVILFDNLSPAVKKILAGTERELTPIFDDFVRHYRFEHRFCNPGSGWEKGHCEGKVGYVRRNFLTPLPVIDSLDDLDALNEALKRDLTEDRKREHSAKHQPIEELWKHDQEVLLPLPTEQFEPVRALFGKVNKYGEVKINTDEYHVPKANHRQNIFIKVHWDKLEFYDEYGQCKLSETPRKYALSAEKIDWSAELGLFKNKPRAIEQGTYLKALPSPVKHYLIPTDLNERRNRIKTVLALLEKYTITEVTDIVKSGMQYGKFDLASLTSLAGYQKAIDNQPNPLEESWTPQSVVHWSPNLAVYNQLSPGGDVK